MSSGSTSTVTATQDSETSVTTSTLFTAGFDATWEIDVFGGFGAAANRPRPLSRPACGTLRTPG
jgi:hypothetical protein